MKKLRIPLLVVILVAAMLLPVSAGEKVTLCHKPGTPAEITLTVGAAAADAHLAHGDYLGECTNASEGCQALNDPGLDVVQLFEGEYDQTVTGSFNAGETISADITVELGLTEEVFVWASIWQSEEIVTHNMAVATFFETKTVSVEWPIQEAGDFELSLFATQSCCGQLDDPWDVTSVNFSCTAATP